MHGWESENKGVKCSVKAESRFLEKVNKGLGMRRKSNLLWEKNFRKDD